YAYLITNILSDPQAQCITFGCGGLNVSGRQVAIKTGSSEPYENSTAIGDTWAMGYTPNLVVGVWVGNADNSPMSTNTLSTSVSWPAMRDFMVDALDGEPALEFQQPPGVVKAAVCVPSYMLPSADCGRTTEDLWVADALPKEKDDWWKPFQIDIRNGLLATEMTPPQFIQDRPFLVLPGSLSDAERTAALDVASGLGLPLAPSERSSPSDMPASISSPAWNANVGGVVTVVGRAASNDFDSYRLEYGAGASPTDWTVIQQSSTPVTDSTLGSWDTRGLSPGKYTLRLVVSDRTRGELTTLATVNVSIAAAATTTPKPKTATPKPTMTPIW
ncbi:MAG: hypothetical protein ABR978_05600, partial [Dehalococcoidia bacterium]